MSALRARLLLYELGRHGGSIEVVAPDTKDPEMWADRDNWRIRIYIHVPESPTRADVLALVDSLEGERRDVIDAVIAAVDLSGWQIPS